MSFTPTYKLATIVIAPVASGYTADYYTDGTADNVEIQAAITALSSGGGRIVFTEGSYGIADKILINKSNVTLEGAGNSTILTAINSLNKDMFLISLTGGSANISNVTIKSMKIDGNNSHQSSGHIINSYGMKLCSFEDIQFYNAYDYAINLDGTFQGSVDSYWNRVVKCQFENGNIGGWIKSVNSHENLYYSNIMVGSGPGKYGIDIGIGWDLIYGNKFGGGFGSTAGTPALVNLGGTISTRLIANQFNGSLRELLRVTGNGMVIESNQFSNPSVNNSGVYPSIYVNSKKNLINQNIFFSDTSVGSMDIQEDTGASGNIIAHNQLQKGIIGNGIGTIAKDNLGDSIITSATGNGWLVNSVDTQVITKSNSWNPDATQIAAQLAAIKALGATHVAHAIPYNNTAKWTLWMPLIRAAGLVPVHRSHWNEWEGDNGTGNVSSLTRSGTTATAVTGTAHGLQTGDTVSMNGMDQHDYRGEFTVTVTNSTTFTYTVANSPVTPATGSIGWRYGRATYFRKMVAFIVANPTFFADGDPFGACVEAQQAANTGCQFFTQGTTNFDYTLYNQFLKDEVTQSNSAFATIGKKITTWPISFGVSNLNLAGETLDSGSTGNSSGLTDDDIVTYFNGILTIDHYLSNTYRSTDAYGTKYGSDLDKIHRAFPSCKIFIGEFGYPTNAVLSDNEQFLVYQQVVEVLLSKPYIVGVNFWDHLGGTNESLFTDSAGSIVTPGRKAVKAVKYAFTSRAAAN